MRYGQIKNIDVANGPGIRTSLFVVGCTHHCLECFNVEYQNFNAGKEWTQKEVDILVKQLSLSTNDGLSLLGGEPMQNAIDLLKLVKELKERVPKDFSIWLWSGYTFETILKDENMLALLKEIDVLVDGLFIIQERDLKIKFRGSRNQRIINVQKSLKENNVSIIKDEDIKI